MAERYLQYFPNVMSISFDVFMRPASGGTRWNKVERVVDPKVPFNDIESRADSHRNKGVLRTDILPNFEIQSWDFSTWKKFRQDVRAGVDLLFVGDAYTESVIASGEADVHPQIWVPASPTAIPAGTKVPVFIGFRNVRGLITNDIVGNGDEVPLIVAFEVGKRPAAADNLVHFTPPDITQVSATDLDWKAVPTGATYAAWYYDTSDGAFKNS